MTPPDITLASLLSFRAGDAVRITRLDAGRGLKLRLLALGLVPGAAVYILDKNHGPLTLCVNNSRIAIGRGMAQKIYAETAPPPACVECGADGPCPHRK